MIGLFDGSIPVLRNSSLVLARCLLALLFAVTSTANASAHVKWFCAYDVAGQPLELSNVLCQDFEILIFVAAVGLLAGCFLEKTPLGEAMLRSMDRVTIGIRLHTEEMVRAFCFFFFIGVWTLGGILLTPELTSKSLFLPPLQFTNRGMPNVEADFADLRARHRYSCSAWRYTTTESSIWPTTQSS